jgi:hypothetical protein
MAGGVTKTRQRRGQRLHRINQQLLNNFQHNDTSQKLLHSPQENDSVAAYSPSEIASTRLDPSVPISVSQ